MKKVKSRILKIRNNLCKSFFVCFVRIILQFIDFVCNIDKVKQNNVFTRKKSIFLTI